MRRWSWIAASVLLAALCSCSARAPIAVQPTETPSSSPTSTSMPSAFPTRPSATPSAHAPNPDPLHRSGPLIEISIAKQQLTAWRDGKVVMRTPVSTGMPGYETPRGHFHVIYKDPKAWSAQWGVWMPWALNFYRDYSIHQLPHYPNSPINIGASKLGTAASHGCVRVGIPAAERLFEWARVGMPVWVH